MIRFLKCYSYTYSVIIICYFRVQLYVLYEHATGYALFHVQEVEEIGALLPTVEKAITDCSLFKSVVKLIAFSPFKSGTNALDNVNSLSEGE